MTNTDKFKQLANELDLLYEKKNNAYGNSFGETFKKLGIISAVTRISDKYNRLCNLATNPLIDNLGESLEDTLKDLASYCIMTLIELDRKDDLIRVGDKFVCIKNVVMDDDFLAYKMGDIYNCEIEGCITDLDGDCNHNWSNKCLDGADWQFYFKRIKK